MAKYKIFAEEARSFVIEVEAESLDEAINLVDMDPGAFVPDDNHGDYIDGSFNVNVDFTHQYHEEENERSKASSNK